MKDGGEVGRSLRGRGRRGNPRAVSVNVWSEGVPPSTAPSRARDWPEKPLLFGYRKYRISNCWRLNPVANHRHASCPCATRHQPEAHPLIPRPAY